MLLLSLFNTKMNYNKDKKINLLVKLLWIQLKETLMVVQIVLNIFLIYIGKFQR